MTDEPEATWCDVLVLLDWLKAETEKTKRATAEFERAMWCKRQLEKLELELAQK